MQHSYRCRGVSCAVIYRNRYCYRHTDHDTNRNSNCVANHNRCANINTNCHPYHHPHTNPIANRNACTNTTPYRRSSAGTARYSGH